MNERIEELAQQCTEQLIDYDVGTMYDQVDYRKFAELIIKESIKVMMENDYHGEWLGEKLKEHFGVDK